MLEYGRAKRAQASDVLPARLDEVHKFGNLVRLTSLSSTSLARLRNIPIHIYLASFAHS